jgi:cell division septal protein FtsQ
LREQVVAQKVGNRTGMGKGKSAVGQRPAKRDREPGETIAARLRSLVTYIPLALRIGVAAIIALVGLVGYQAAASADFFKVRKVETRGAVRASSEEIKAAVLRDVGETGVWRADLDQVRKHLERLPWVRTAVVTRVLPDGIRVRITERQPTAVVRTGAGRFIWVDDEAVYLGEMVSSDQMPAFFLRGWNEEDSTAAQTENRERLKKFLELQSEWTAQSISERVSEVNLLELRDVRVQLAGDDSQIEVRLGGQDQAERLKKALTVLDTQRQTARGPLISYIDLSQGKRAVVGLVTGNQTISDRVADGSESARR